MTTNYTGAMMDNGTERFPDHKIWDLHLTEQQRELEKFFAARARPNYAVYYGVRRGGRLDMGHWRGSSWGDAERKAGEAISAGGWGFCVRAPSFCRDPSAVFRAAGLG